MLAPPGQLIGLEGGEIGFGGDRAEQRVTSSRVVRAGPDRWPCPAPGTDNPHGRTRRSREVPTLAQVEPDTTGAEGPQLPCARTARGPSPDRRPRRPHGRPRIDRCRLASFSALKTVDPALDDLVGRVVAGVERRGKFVCIDGDGLWLVVHLARGGWVKWFEALPDTALRPGRSPIALRLGLDDGSGFDVTEMGTEKRVALWVVASPEEVEPARRAGDRPPEPGLHRRAVRRRCCGPRRPPSRPRSPPRR